MKRRGLTLVEMVAVIAVSTVVLGIAVGLMHTLLRTEGAARDLAHHVTVVSQLAEQFRGDAHEALRARPLGATGSASADLDKTLAEPVARAPGCELQLPTGRTVLYQAAGDGIMRIEQAGQTVAHQERFSLPPDSTAAFEVGDTAGAAIVSLIIAQPEQASGAMRIDAVVGRDHRFAPAKENRP